MQISFYSITINSQEDSVFYESRHYTLHLILPDFLSHLILENYKVLHKYERTHCKQFLCRIRIHVYFSSRNILSSMAVTFPGIKCFG